MEPLTALNRALADLEAEREQLDQDIEALRRIIARRNPGAVQPAVVANPPFANGARSKRKRPSEARDAILALMADGQIWTPASVARERGTSPQAATKVFARMLEEAPAPIRKVGAGHQYKLASSEGDDDAQGSLPVAPGSDASVTHETKVGD